MTRILFFLVPVMLLFVSCGETKKKQAVTDIDKLYKMYPDSVPILIQHGNKMMERYDYDAALKDGAKAYRMQPKNIEARFLYANALNNRAARTAEDIQIAQDHFKYVIKKQPRNLKALVALASTYSQMGDYEKSFQYINTALRIDKRYRDAYVLKGTNYDRNEKLLIIRYCINGSDRPAQEHELDLAVGLDYVPPIPQEILRDKHLAFIQ